MGRVPPSHKPIRACQDRQHRSPVGLIRDRRVPMSAASEKMAEAGNSHARPVLWPHSNQNVFFSAVPQLQESPGNRVGHGKNQSHLKKIVPTLTWAVRLSHHSPFVALSSPSVSPTVHEESGGLRSRVLWLCVPASQHWEAALELFLLFRDRTECFLEAFGFTWC